MHPTHNVNCNCHNHDLSLEFAKFCGRVAAVIVHNTIQKHRPDLAVKAKVITWKQFRHLRVQQPASK